MAAIKGYGFTHLRSHLSQRVISLVGPVLLILVVAGMLLTAPASAQSRPRVLHLRFSGPVTPAMLSYLERGLRQAETEGDVAVVFSLDTPGGSLDVTKDIMQAIEQSSVPVIVYVAPARAWAASAGTLITLSGHLAAMAPETLIGAASPVNVSGEDLPETERMKVTEALSAAARSLAERRGEKAVTWAADTIQSAKAATATEALAIGVIDVIASDVDDLLLQLDGRKVVVNGAERTLNLRDAETVEMGRTFFEDLLALLSSPTVAAILLTLGLNAILYELSAPGGYVAGAIGVIALLLAFYSLGTIEANWAGLAFIGIAFTLFVVEVKVHTGGILTIAGLVAFILGYAMLFDTPYAPIPWVVILGMAAAMALCVAVAVRLVVHTQRRPSSVGGSALIGREGNARTLLDPDGTVYVNGARWEAHAEESPIEEGALVIVTHREGHRLWVRQVSSHLRG